MNLIPTMLATVSIYVIARKVNILWPTPSHHGSIRSIALAKHDALNCMGHK